jgi:uncharacterized membrane protein SpoIIM required for sporulation
MEPHGRYLVFALFIVAFFGGLVAYGLIVGMLPAKSGPLKRSDSPAAFYAGIIVYSFIALAAAVGALDLVLRMNHHPGLW